MTTEPNADENAPNPATEPEQNDDQRGGNDEAARHRVRAREAENERDAAREQLTATAARVAALEKRNVDRIVGAVVAEPGDWWLLSGVTADDLPRDDGGDVDETAVAALVEDFARQRPQLTHEGVKRARGKVGPHPGGQGQRGSVIPTAPTWAEVLTRGR